ncbi:rRNA methyltransferase 3, mitochondrial [Spea bombifrons]|uniref:rRNA methyltransferase 3, mitochondrial n=1 Tax=Spea bombifrons TaxID=233779 RepID=UPI00234B666A|nr:rRNA methyltransferase 3, mitochondrial [Spea bombifrons]
MAALMRGVLRSAGLTQVTFTGSIQAKRHVRTLRRTPVRAIQAGTSPGENEPVLRVPKVSGEPAASRVGRTPAVHTPVRDPIRHNTDPAGQAVEAPELHFEKAHADDKRLSKVVSLAKSKKFRDRHGQVLLEGRRLLWDALEAGSVLKTLFFSRVDHLKELPADKLKNAKLIKVKFEDIKMWSDVVSPQGLIGIVVRPDHAKMNYPVAQLKHSLPLSLICDNIRDPGNLGTILRCAAGVGCNKVLLTKGCVDAWEPKVLRSGMGAHFRLPVITSLEWDVVPNYLTEDTKVFLADNISPERYNQPEGKLESESGYGWVSSNPRRIYNLQEDYDCTSSDEDSDGEEHYIPEIQTQRYDERWAQKPSALVIGGETHGLSLESLLLAEKFSGRRLFIPVVPGVDSLNSAMAASILLFEGKRQLQLNRKV